MGPGLQQTAAQVLSPGRVAGTGRRDSLPLRLHWTLRLAAGLCFIGHGAFGILTKSGWIPFFALVGIPEEIAYRLMPLVGTMDITLGVWVLFRPRRVFLLYMACWATWTALLRPLTGMGIWEFLERAGNYGVPLALLALHWPQRSLRAWGEPVPPDEPSQNALRRAAWILRLSVCALMVGHAGLALSQKPLLIGHMESVAALGRLGSPASVLMAVGGIEIALGLSALLAPRRPLLLLTMAWKLTTEALHPVSGAPIWEFVERAGSYAAPLALVVALALLSHPGSDSPDSGARNP